MRRRTRSDEMKKIDRLEGLKVILATWRALKSEIMDPSYVESLVRRIKQGETRIENGL